MSNKWPSDELEKQMLANVQAIKMGLREAIPIDAARDVAELLARVRELEKSHEADAAMLAGMLKAAEVLYGKLNEAGDLQARVRELEAELGHYSTSAGMADQYRAEAKACRVALGFPADSDEVAPCDLTEAIKKLQNPCPVSYPHLPHERPTRQTP
jgi:hypothetical protein